MFSGPAAAAAAGALLVCRGGAELAAPVRRKKGFKQTNVRARNRYRLLCVDSNTSHTLTASEQAADVREERTITSASYFFFRLPRTATPCVVTPPVSACTLTAFSGSHGSAACRLSWCIFVVDWCGVVCVRNFSLALNAHAAAARKKTHTKTNLHRLEVGRGDAADRALELAVPDLAAQAVGVAGRAAALFFCLGGRFEEEGKRTTDD